MRLAASCLAFLAASSAAATTIAPTMPSPAELVMGVATAEDGPDVAETTEAPSPWTGSVGLGFSASRTDTDTVGLNATATATRKGELSTWASSLKYIFNSDDGEVEDNFLIVQSEFDQLFAAGSPWNWFGQGSYQFNETESYRQRIRGYGGAGYYVSRTDELRWNLKGGIGALWNDRGSQNGWTARTLVGTTSEWKPIEGLVFKGSLSIENDVEDFMSYFLVTEIRLDVALAAMAKNLSVYLTFRDEYDSTPGVGDQWNSMWLTLGLAYGF